MSHPTETEVLILGAGPAGLSLGRELSVRQIPYLILDKQSVVGSTFVKMTDSTTYGPWLNNTLPGSPVPWLRRLSRTTRAEYACYLQTYAKEHALNVLLEAEVVSVERQTDGFLLETSDGTCYRAPILVNATGQYSKPNLPNYTGQEKCRIPRIHSADYRSPQTIRALSPSSRPKVLIVGSGLSAGEIMQELYESGCEVHLSHRERIETWPSPLEETLLSPLTYLWEEFSLRLGLPRPSNLRPRLRRGRQLTLLVTHQVWTHPAISYLELDHVVFVDGARDRYDAIVYATGYRPAVDHLAPMLSGALRVDGLASVDVLDLYFLGLPDSRTFRSEFLRGIREDATYLAKRLQERLRVLHRSKDLPAPQFIGDKDTADRSSEEKAVLESA